MGTVTIELEFLNAIGTIEGGRDQVVALNTKDRECVVTIMDNEVKAVIWIVWLVETYDIDYLIMVIVSLENKKMDSLQNSFFISRRAPGLASRIPILINNEESYSPQLILRFEPEEETCPLEKRPSHTVKNLSRQSYS